MKNVKDQLVVSGKAFLPGEMSKNPRYLDMHLNLQRDSTSQLFLLSRNGAKAVKVDPFQGSVTHIIDIGEVGFPSEQLTHMVRLQPGDHLTLREHRIRGLVGIGNKLKIRRVKSD